MELFLKAFGKNTINMMQRALLRSVIMGALFIVAYLILNFLIESARSYGSDWPDRFPELLVILRAVAILTWFEKSIFWIRLAVEPKLDSQAIADATVPDPAAAASVYRTRVFMWAFRIVILMTLCGFWP